MLSEITASKRPENGVDQGVQPDIAIRVAFKGAVVVDAHDHTA